MIIKIWGSRGSIACPAPENLRYGGNTSCISIEDESEDLIVLDAGTGIQRLGLVIKPNIKRIHIFLTHLHLDHLQGLGFFAPIYNSKMEVHIYGPAKSNKDLRQRLTRYLSLPLFPVLLRDVPCNLHLHGMIGENFTIGPYNIFSQLVCHPGLTLGYRIESPWVRLAYIPDHEPALGVKHFPDSPTWTSGYEIAKEVDLLFHDAQYTHQEYESRVGWGHSILDQAFEFGILAKIKKFITFHHDPFHNDEMLDTILQQSIQNIKPYFPVESGKEGDIFLFSSR